MESVEIARLKYFRSILRTKNNISNNLIRLVLCLLKMEFLLFNKLLNVIKKYKIHFEENITIHYKIVNAFNERINAHLFLSERIRYMNIKYSIIMRQLNKKILSLIKIILIIIINIIINMLTDEMGY